jgi:hypothetical protein
MKYPELRMNKNDLYKRYSALGRLEEYPGKRTFVGKCSTFELFLENGPSFAGYIEESPNIFKDIMTDYPGLIELVKEAWPI